MIYALTFVLFSLTGLLALAMLPGRGFLPLPPGVHESVSYFAGSVYWFFAFMPKTLAAIGSLVLISLVRWKFGVLIGWARKLWYSTPIGRLIRW